MIVCISMNITFFTAFCAKISAIDPKALLSGGESIYDPFVSLLYLA